MKKNFQHSTELLNISKAVIFAGGKGTRLAEQTNKIPKPMVLVHDTPLIIHIVKRLAKHGIKDFYILGGYKIEVIWYYLFKNANKDLSFENLSHEHLTVVLNDEQLKDVKIHLIDTGEESGTATRLSLVKEFLNDEPFVMTYGDTYSDVDITSVENVLYNSTEQTILSLCAIPYKERFGLVTIQSDSHQVKEFKEKSESSTQFINGGYMCVKPEIFNIITDNDDDFSKDVLESERLKDKISAYIHNGYWKAVDSQRDLEVINDDYNKHNEYFIIN